MFKYAASLFGCFALLSLASTASAAPISLCTTDVNLNIHCDLDMNGSTFAAVDPTTFPDPNNPPNNIVSPGWLVGYSFLLQPGLANYTNPGDVDAVVRIHSSFFDVFTELDPNFGTILNDALSLTPIDGTSLSTGQVVGNPFFGGAQSNGDIGIISESPTGLALLTNVLYDVGQGDSFAIQSNLPQVGPPEVPEPATLSLLGIGLCFAAARGYRAHRKPVA